MFPVNKHYRSFIWFKTAANLRSEASKTYLSFAWWVLEPVISMSIYYVVFGKLLQRGTADFVPFLLIGLTCWQWFASSCIHAASTINAQKALVCQQNFPKIILPSIAIFTDGIKFLIVFMLLLIFLWLYGLTPNQHYIYIPVLLLIQYIFICGISYACTIATTFVPDFQFLLQNILRLGMFMSGIFYAIASLPEQYQAYFAFNPMAILIDSYRDILMHNQAPNIEQLLPILIASIAVLIISTWLFKHLDPIIPRTLMQR